ncbi:MAG: hypothetical protein ACFFBP_17360 [Promethearchaeota archaeon]
MTYKNTAEKGNWIYSNKSTREIFQKNEHVKNIRKKLVKAKIDKQRSKYSTFNGE